MSLGLGLGLGIGGAGVGAGSNPISSGLLLDVDAALGITLSGSNVSAWADQSGHGANLTQGTGGNQPPYTASDASMNGRPSVGINGGAIEIFGTITVPQPNTIYLVGYMAASSGKDLFDGHTTRQSIGVDGTGYYAYAGTNVVHFGPATNANIHVWAVVFNGASSAGAVDASSGLATLSVTPGANSLVGPSVAGAFPNTASAVGRVIIYSGAHTQANVATMFTYLGAKFGKSWS